MSDENQEPQLEKTVNPLFMALIMIFLGIILIALNFHSIETNNKVYPKFFTLGMMSLYFGISILISPPKKPVYCSKIGKFSTSIFSSGTAWNRFVWIFYLVISFAASLYIIIVAETWEEIRSVFYITGVLTGIFIAVQNIIPLCKKEIKPLYIGAVVGGLVFAVTFITPLFDHTSPKETLFYNDFIKENLDNEFPVHFVRTSDAINAVVSIRESDDEENKDYNYIRLGDIIREVILYSNFGKNFKSYAKGHATNLVLEHDDDYTVYSSSKLKKIKEVRIADKARTYSSFELNNSQEKIQNILCDNLDSNVIFEIPQYENEYCLVWTIEGFTEYYNKISHRNEDNAFTDQDLMMAFSYGSFDDSLFRVAKLSDVIEEILYEEDGTTGCYFNFNTEENYIAYPDTIQYIYENIIYSLNDDEPEEDDE